MSVTTIETGYVNLEVSDGTSMAAYTAKPSDTTGAPGLLVLQEAFGVTAHIRSVAERFAKDGFFTVAPELFHRTAPGAEFDSADFPAVMPHYQALTDAGLTADIQAAFDYLNSTPRPTASIGYCLGGKVSFLSSMVLPVKCSVCYYGGGIAPSERGPGLLSRVSEIHAPLLLCWGGKDGHLGPDQRAAIETALIEADKPYINAVFSRANHAFNRDGSPSYDAESAAEALALALRFMAHHLAA